MGWWSLTPVLGPHTLAVLQWYALAAPLSKSMLSYALLSSALVTVLGGKGEEGMGVEK